MSATKPPNEVSDAEPDEKLEFYYEGSQFPWFMRLVWIGFLVFAVVYTIKWFVPDLMAYLDHGLDLMR